MKLECTSIHEQFVLVIETGSKLAKVLVLFFLVSDAMVGQRSGGNKDRWRPIK